MFSDYHGVDFSGEMIKLARKKNPDKLFEIEDIKEFDGEKYDLIFEVNSLHTLGMSPEDSFNKFRKHARKAIACLECDKFTIFNIYDGKRD